MNPSRLAVGGPVRGTDLKKLRAGAVALAITLFTLNLIDIFITNFNITRFGATEVNRLFAPFIGTPMALVLKLGIPLWIIALSLRVKSRLSLTVLEITVAIYMAVVIIGVGQALFASV